MSSNLVSDFIAQVERALEMDSSLARCGVVLKDFYTMRTEFLQSFVERLDLMESVKERSALHEDGFDRFVLIEGPLWRLRLNVWWPQAVGRLRASLGAHSHTWNHTSVILTGVMRNCFFVDDGGEDYYVYESEGAGSPEMKTRWTGMGGLRAVEELVIPEGDIYTQRADQLHRVMPDTEVLATFCLQRLGVSRRALLYAPRPWNGARVDYRAIEAKSRFEPAWQRAISAIARS